MDFRKILIAYLIAILFMTFFYFFIKKYIYIFLMSKNEIRFIKNFLKNKQVKIFLLIDKIKKNCFIKTKNTNLIRCILG